LSTIPRHLAVIPDGNRRWARARGQEPAQGHAAGIANIGRVAAAAWGAGVEVFTFWWGSPANLERREPDEVRAIVGVLADWLRGSAPALLTRHGARFDAHGRWREHCPELLPAVEVASRPSGDRRMVLLMAYDGRDEIRAAADALKGGGATEAELGAALWTGELPPVDLVLRTGGQPHLSSGFMLWHIAESVLHFSELMWPDFGPAALGRALDEYGATPRRHGR
jgi:undecaprenyl diphosphate synthase